MLRMQNRQNSESKYSIKGELSMNFAKHKPILFAAAVCCAALMPAASILAPAASVFASEEISSDADDSAFAGFYQIGDTMDDFTVTTSDGEELTLSKLLETKKAVVLNFWFSTCQPCAMEFPFLEEAYEEYKDQIEVIAVTPFDDAETVSNYKEEKGLTFPMGEDTAGLCDQFIFDGYPTTIVIDRFGTVCFLESGSQPSAYAFKTLFSAYTADDYTESLLDYTIPSQKPDCTMPPAEEVAASLNVDGGSFTFSALDDEYSWPWLLKEDGDLTVAYASNSGIGNSSADLCTEVSAKAGDALAFDYKVSACDGASFFTLTVDDTIVKVFSGDRDWASYAYQFEEDGDHTVIFSYTKDDSGNAYDDTVLLDNVQLLSGDDAEAAVAANPVYPTAEKEDAVEITPVSEDAREIILYDQEDGTLSEDVSDMINSYFNENVSFYLIPSETADFNVLIGSDYDPDGASYYCNYDGLQEILSSCDSDENGFKASSGIDSVNTTGYSWSALVLYPQFDDYSIFYPVVFFTSEEDLNYFCQVEFTDDNYEPFEGLSWKYADGELPSTDALPSTDNDNSISDALVSYQIIFKDQNGDPVPGVIANVCDDSTCDPKTAGDDGVISFEAAPFAYAIHVLKVPEGYEFDTTQEFTAEEAGGVLEITVTKN